MQLKITVYNHNKCHVNKIKTHGTTFVTTTLSAVKTKAAKFAQHIKHSY